MTNTDADRLRTAIERTEAALAAYHADPGQRTLGELIDAWDALINPPLAVLLTSSMRARAATNLARALRARGADEPGGESTDRAVALLEEARTLTPADGDDWREATRLLAMLLQDRYEVTGTVSDLHRAADLLRQVMNHPAEPDVIAASVELAACLLTLDSVGESGLEDAITVLEEARPTTRPADPTVAAERGYALGVALATRFARSGNPNDAREELGAFREAVAFDFTGEAAKYRDGLGGAYQDQWRLTGDPSWLTRSLAEYEQAMAADPPQPEALRIRRNIGDALHSRFEYSGDSKDLADALEHLRAALDGSPDDPRFAVSYAAALLDAYRADGMLQRLSDAIRLLEQASAGFPVGSPDYRAAQTCLGNALRARFARDGNRDDLDRAIRCHSAAADSVTGSAPDAAVCLAMYGHALHELFVQTGDERDLDASVQMYARAAAHAMGSGQDVIHAAAGVGGLESYRHSGDPARLQAAIDSFSQASQMCPPASSALLIYLSDLGTAYRLRYLHTGQLRDLERAIASLDDAIALTGKSSPDRGALLTTRGMLWLDSYNRTGDLGTVDQAVADLAEAVAATPERAPRRSDGQASLASALVLRSELAALTSGIEADENDVDNAITLLESALSLSPERAASRPEYLGKLGDALLSRYRRAGRKSDLDAAIGLLDDAWRSADATGKAGLAEIRAHAYRMRWSSEQQDDDLGRSIEMYDEASRPGLGQGPGQIAEAALDWGRWAMSRRAWPEAARAYRRCLENIAVLSASHAARYHKDAWLEPATEAPSRVAYAYARAGDPVTASALFERGRGFLLNESAEWRRKLQDEHPDLHTRLRDALAAADAMAAATRATVPSTGARYLSAGQPERIYAELDAVLAEIERLTGGTAAVPLGQEGSAPRYLDEAWVVRLAPGPESSVALVSAPGEDRVTAMALTEAAELRLGEQLAVFRSGYEQRRKAPSAWHAALDAVAGWLGQAVCRPLMAVIPEDADVVVVGGGALGLLPLHAAWISDPGGQDGRRYLLDHARIRHAPNIASLRQIGPGVWGVKPSKIFLVDDPRPETMPVRAARLDPDFLSRYFGECIAIAGPDATRANVLRTITEAGCDVIHLSCHGRADFATPMESAFLLAGDDTMTVRDLFGAPAALLRLGVLAGCETGVAGSNLPDEALGLPTALMAAGVAGVIASAWAIPDQLVTGVLLARFYELWRSGQDPPAEALRQAQRWIRDSSNGQKAEQYPWYGDAHPGRPGGAAHQIWLSARTHRHPYWWAGFTYSGA